MYFFQVEVSVRSGFPDVAGEYTRQRLIEWGFTKIESIRSSRLFTVGLLKETPHQALLMEHVADKLLTDPVCERYRIVAAYDPAPPIADATVLEVHFRPGVTDTVAASTLLAAADLGVPVATVATARRFAIRPMLAEAEARRLARLLGNDCIEEVVPSGKPIGPPPCPPVYDFQLRRFRLLDLDDHGLERLSRQAHLFLSIGELRAIQAHYRTFNRDPTDLELETFAQTWSEHCIHKTMKSAFVYRGDPFPAFSSPGPGTGQVTIAYDNLFDDTIAKATRETIRQGRGPACLSVFTDNAGIIAFDDDWAIAFKLETHNHPSAIEPYGGAATGIGGVIRDILGCGLGARPVACTDVFCVAPPDWPFAAVLKGVIHPRSILRGVVAGVRDYGNRMGIPTVNGAIHFDARYLGNPLVFCGCVGLIPRNRILKGPRPGDLIVLIGGRTGRDGIHGATFSSAELTDTHEDEFASAVQIGNPIEEKKVLDVILQARDYRDQPNRATTIAESRCLYSAITDCGAGGLSSAVGEMAAETGAEVDLEKVPLKYAGLRYDEIWISEAQERMVLAVPPSDATALLALAHGEDVEATIIGHFTNTGRLVVRYQGVEVGNLDLRFLHHGLPKAVRQAEWLAGKPGEPRSIRAATVRERSSNSDRAPLPHGRGSDSGSDRDLAADLLRRLSNPTTASKHWVIRQYDHEVQAGSVIKPLVGPHDGPSDAAVLRPRLDSNRGIALGCGLAPDLADVDPYLMALSAIDEALRNVVCVGGNPSRTALLDNFCWPRTDDARNLGALVRACQACHDVAAAYGLPFISGKDSLNNEFALDPADIDKVRRAIRSLDAEPDVDPASWHGRGLGQPRSPAAHAQEAWPPQAAAMPRDPIIDGRLAIPCTLLISAVSLIDDVNCCVSMDLKQDAAELYLVGQPSLLEPDATRSRPLFDLNVAAQTHHAVAGMIRDGLVRAVHDVSEGGLLVACAEMAMAAGRSCRVHGFELWRASSLRPGRSPKIIGGDDEDERTFYFAESPALYVVEVAADKHDAFADEAAAVPSLHLATVTPTPAGHDAVLEVDSSSGPTRLPLTDLRRAWQSPLDW